MKNMATLVGKEAAQTSPCCGAISHFDSDTGRIASWRCSSCRNFWATHHPDPAASHDPWGGKSVTPEFLETLRYRRQIQAEEIFVRFRSALEAGGVLDYGCGQGAFLSFLKSRGIDAMGCDLSPISAQGGSGVREAFIQLDKPWKVPEGKGFKTVTMLDVLEHCDRPQELIRGLMSLGTSRFLIKIPLAGGPAFFVARIFAKFGRYDLLDKLYLAGEAAPHLLYFTAPGVVRLFEECGLRMTARLNLAEIGSELPSRIRGGSQNPIVRQLFAFMGACAGLISRVWSDTAVFEFEVASKAR